MREGCAFPMRMVMVGSMIAAYAKILIITKKGGKLGSRALRVAEKR